MTNVAAGEYPRFRCSRCHDTLAACVCRVPGFVLCYESAQAIHRKLATEHPESSDWSSELGGTLTNIAMIDVDSKRVEQALAKFREAIEWQFKALAANPANPTYRQFLANTLTT